MTIEVFPSKLIANVFVSQLDWWQHIYIEVQTASVFEALLLSLLWGNLRLNP